MAKQRLNPRQEKFVREYVKTGNGRKSYAKAYGVNGATADVNASRALKNAKIESAIVGYQMRAKTRHDYTVDTLLGELDEARDVALGAEMPQTSAAVQATTVKAKLLGMIVDRKETGTPGEFAALDTVKAILEAARKELGHEAVIALAALINEPLTIEAKAETSEGDE